MPGRRAHGAGCRAGHQGKPARILRLLQCPRIGGDFATEVAAINDETHDGEIEPYIDEEPTSDKYGATPRVRGLDRRQEMAIIALLNEPTIRKASELARVCEATMRRWLKQDAFKRAYREARREAFAHAIAMTQKYAPLAVQSLAKILADEKVTASSRVQAATALLKFARESVEIDELVERVERLENAADVGGDQWSAADVA
jgi:hypothetical protein